MSPSHVEALTDLELWGFNKSPGTSQTSQERAKRAFAILTNCAKRFIVILVFEGSMYLKLTSFCLQAPWPPNLTPNLIIHGCFVPEDEQ